MTRQITERADTITVGGMHTLNCRGAFLAKFNKIPDLNNYCSTHSFWLKGALLRNLIKNLLALVVFCCMPGLAGLATAQSVGGAAISNKDQPTDITAREQLLSQVQAGRQSTAGVLPFGANLFHGGFSNDREDGINPDYAISPGDRISVRIYGAKDFNDELIVDHQGNIFVPEIGPIPLAGVANRDLNQRVTSAVGQKYKNNVKVYTSLNGSQPVAVFVTGFVTNPGRFAGIPSNSLLYFIDKAGGVDHDRGSFRNIVVQRSGEEIASVDLYEFILEGRLPHIQFSDGDTIVVKRRGGVVEAAGAIRNPAQFEIQEHPMLGHQLIDAALLDSDVSHVGVSGTRNGEPLSKYVPLAEFAKMTLHNGDQVSFRSDMHDKVIVIEMDGSYIGPSRYTVPQSTRLIDLLDHIEVDLELTDTKSIYLRRKSIAKRQKAALLESLQRLESKYLTTTSLTATETGIRSTDAKLIGEFVQRAREVKPSGRLVVSSEDKIANILLQQGDIITIPSKSDSVLLSGEVLVSQAMLYDGRRRAREYIERSGGFTKQADKRQIVVVHANGEVTTGQNPAVKAGDEIIVLPKVPVKNVQLASTIVDILYKIAVAASVAVKL